VTAGSNSINIKRLGRKSKASIVATGVLTGTMMMTIKTANTYALLSGFGRLPPHLGAHQQITHSSLGDEQSTSSMRAEYQ